MRFKRRLNFIYGSEQINIIPLINVVFLLLIFLMFSPNFVMQSGISVNLPRAVTSEVVKYENINLVISSENVIYINGKVITDLELKPLFKQAAKRNQAILIKADKRASLGKAVEIWDLARDLGITQVNIATNQD